MSDNDLKNSHKGKWGEIKNKLVYVKCLKIRGENDEQIAKKLGICHRTLKKYKDEYPEFADALSFDKQVADSMVEAALLRLATGYEIKSKKKVKLKDIHYDENGKKVEKEMLEPSTEISEVAPNLAAQTFWLKNRCPERWNDETDKDEDTKENGVVILPEITEMVDLLKEETLKDE